MPEGRLEVIAEAIKAEYGKGIEAQFTIGRLLLEARRQFDAAGGGTGVDSPNVLFGRWLDQQNFPFSKSVAYRLRIGAEREPEVRALLVQPIQREQGGPERTVSGMVQRLIAKPKPVNTIPPEEVTPVDPAYAALRAARNAIVGFEGDQNAFLAMHVDDMAAAAGMIQAIANAYTEARNVRNR